MGELLCKTLINGLKWVLFNSVLDLITFKVIETNETLFEADFNKQKVQTCIKRPVQKPPVRPFLLGILKYGLWTIQCSYCNSRTALNQFGLKNFEMLNVLEDEQVQKKHRRIWQVSRTNIVEKINTVTAFKPEKIKDSLY